MQQKSEEKCSHAARLKNLRLKRQCNWSQIADDIGLSESMIYAVIAGRKPLGEKSLYRLGELEAASGLDSPPAGQVLELPTVQTATKKSIAPRDLARLQAAIAALEKQITALREVVEAMQNGEF